MQFITSFLSSVATQSPLFLVWIGGIVIAVARYPRHPGASKLAIGALAALFVIHLGSSIFTASMPLWLYDSGMDSRTIGWVYTGVFASESLAAAAANAVLLAAVFHGRPAENAL